MRVAIVGGGISGLLVGYLLSDEHEVVLFEANDYLGGHANTVVIEREDASYALDTGFVVFNHRTYPHFTRLLERLGVKSEPSNMSFSVKCERSGLEYKGSSLGTLFAQRRNLLSPRFYRMLADILRFNRKSPQLLNGAGQGPSLGDCLAAQRYSRAFVELYLVPMASAIWSADPRGMLDFPARTLVRFFHNHGFLSVIDHPQWRVIRGGSRRYVQAITRPYESGLRLRNRVRSIARRQDAVLVSSAQGGSERFDRVVLATHSDQALSHLSDPSEAEREILRALPYQENRALLHTDSSLLPRSRRAWASWNYHLLPEQSGRALVTYYLNSLQNLRARETFCVSLNRPEAIDPSRILERFTYHHPVVTFESEAARKRHAEINGANRTYYCGAYWGYGFHEDGVRSALEVCRHFGKALF